MALPDKGPLSEFSGRKPAALKWLETEHARVSGRINQLEADLALGKAELKRLKADHAYLTLLLRSDAVAVDPGGIHPIRPQRVHRVLRHGELTRQILFCLKKAGGPVSTPNVTQYVISATGLMFNEAERALFLTFVRKRLRNLAIRGVVKRLHPLKTGRHGLWELA